MTKAIAPIETSELTGPMAAEEAACQLAVKALDTMQLTDQASVEKLSITIAMGKKRAAELKAQEVSITKPQLEAVEKVRAIFRNPMALYKVFEDRGKRKIAQFLSDQQALQARAYQEGAAALASGDRPAAQEALTVAATAGVIAKPAGMSIRYRWAVRVIDPTAVPAWLCSPDEKKILAALSSFNIEEPPPIVAGCEVTKEPIISQRVGG